MGAEEFGKNPFRGDDVDDTVEGELDSEDFLGQKDVEGTDGEVDERRCAVEGQFKRRRARCRQSEAARLHQIVILVGRDEF